MSAHSKLSAPTGETDLPGSGTLENEITDREFETFRRLVHGLTGISLGPQKRHLLRARLGKRLRALKLTTLTEYHRFLQERDPSGEELVRLINAITTNKTDFLREPHHFQFLKEQWAPARKALAARSGDRRVRFWSAGCSTGAEPYTLAFTLAEALGFLNGWDVRILASDIDTDVLRRADAGIYPEEEVAPIPKPVLSHHFLRGVGSNVGLVQVRPELRRLITFRRINLLEKPWPMRSRFDGIFCRNVIIYFDHPTQERVLRRFVDLLREDGFLFLGHSESIHGPQLGLRHVGNTIYQKVAPVREVQGPAGPDWNPASSPLETAPIETRLTAGENAP